MSTTIGERSRARAALVLPTVFAELLDDRRILFIGDAEPEVLERIAGRCRALRVLDTSDGGPRRRARGYRSSPYRPGPLGFQPGAFDAVVVPEIASLGEGDEARGRLGDLARIVDGGPILVGTAPDAGVGYDALYGWLEGLFENVRIFGEVPFEGVAVGDFEAGDAPDVVVDDTLIPEESTPWCFLAVASDSFVRVPSYTVLRLAEREIPVAEARPARDDEAIRKRERALEAENDRLGVALDERISELDDVRGELADLKKRLASAERAAAARVDRLDPDVTREHAELESRLVERAKAIRELEAEVERRGQLVRDAVEEARELRKAGRGDPQAVERAVAAEIARAETQFHVDELRARVRELDETLAVAERREAELDGKARGLLSRLHELSEIHENTAARLGVAEAEVRARDEQRRAIERDLEETKEQLELALVKAHGRDGTFSSATPTSDDSRVARLEGRVAGMRFRLQNAERALASKSVAARRGELALDTVDQLRAELAVQKAENGALTIEVVDLRAATRDLGVRAGDTSSALAARDALVTRLQLELSEIEQQLRNSESRASRLAEETSSLRAALVDAASATEASDRAREDEEALRAQLAELRDRARNLEADRFELEERVERSESAKAGLEARLGAVEGERTELELKAKRLEAEHAALADEVLALATELAQLDEQRRAQEASVPASSEAAERADLMEAEVELLRAHAESLAKERDDARALLEETREMLETLRASSGEGVEAVASAEAPVRGADERDVLLRSLTAQLEERNDRIRALERRLSGSIPAGPADDESLKRELLELQERAARLRDEVAAERDARRLAEARLESLEERPDAALEVGRLRDELGRSRQDLDIERGRAESFERDVRSLREVCVEARQGLEALLGNATSSGDQLVADRVGQLLTILGRY